MLVFVFIFSHRNRCDFVLDVYCSFIIRVALVRDRSAAYRPRYLLQKSILILISIVFSLFLFHRYLLQMQSSVDRMIRAMIFEFSEYSNRKVRVASCRAI